MSITIGTQTIGGTSGGSSSGPAVVPLAGYSAIDATTSPAAAPLAVGGAPLSVDPADFTGSTWTFCVTGYVASGRTATVKLYDVTAGAEAASISITATTQTAYTATVTKPGTARVYRVTFGVDGTLSSHTAVLDGAALKIGS